MSEETKAPRTGSALWVQSLPIVATMLVLGVCVYGLIVVERPSLALSALPLGVVLALSVRWKSRSGS